MMPREQAASLPAAGVLRFGPFRFDRGNGILSRDGAELPLPPRALGVLDVLLAHAGRVVPKQELLDVAWNGAYVTETSLSEAVSCLRQVLADDPQQPAYIQTVHRRGYRFIAAVEAEPAAAAPPLAAPPSNVAPWPVVAPAPAARPQASAPRKGDAEAAATTGRARWRGGARALGAAALVGAALLGGFLAGRRSATEPPTTVRFGFAPPAGSRLTPFGWTLAVSPDGRHVVFVALASDGRTALFDRRLDDGTSHEIAGTRGADGPFFSPDGREVGFFDEGELRRVALAGGPATSIARCDGQRGSWGSDGTIVFSGGRPTSLYAVPAGGGTPRRLTRPEAARGERDHIAPQVLPGGEAVVFTAWGNTTVADARVEWLSLRDGRRHTVVHGGDAAFYASGRLLWTGVDGALVAAPFDPAAGRLTGPPVALLADLVSTPLLGSAQVALGGDTLAYLPAAAPMGQRRIAWLPGLGAPVAGGATPTGEKPLAAPPRFYRNLRVAPDGRLAVTQLDRERSDVWVVEPRTAAVGRLTFEGFNIEPVWSPDGAWVAYASRRNGPFELYRRRADGSAPPELLVPSPHHLHPTAWSPDGRELMVGDVDPNTGFDLWVLDLASRRLRPLLRTPADEVYASWSPDGRWVAYSTDESGRYEVIVRSYPEWAGAWQVSTEGGFSPFWSRDGRTLYFLDDGKVWGVPLDPRERDLRPGAARPLGTTRVEAAGPAPDGGVYAILQQATGDPSPGEVRVVAGWQALLPPER